jgi:hypothetical protein
MSTAVPGRTQIETQPQKPAGDPQPQQSPAERVYLLSHQIGRVRGRFSAPRSRAKDTRTRDEQTVYTLLVEAERLVNLAGNLLNSDPDICIDDV